MPSSFLGFVYCFFHVNLAYIPISVSSTSSIRRRNFIYNCELELYVASSCAHFSTSFRTYTSTLFFFSRNNYRSEKFTSWHILNSKCACVYRKLFFLSRLLSSPCCFACVCIFRSWLGGGGVSACTGFFSYMRSYLKSFLSALACYDVDVIGLPFLLYNFLRNILRPKPIYGRLGADTSPHHRAYHCSASATKLSRRLCVQWAPSIWP